MPYERGMKITSPSRDSPRKRASSPHMNSPLVVHPVNLDSNQMVNLN